MDADDLEAMPQVNAKKKLHKYEKITDLKDMMNKCSGLQNMLCYNNCYFTYN